MGDWNILTTLSFLYWQPIQDDMRIAAQGTLPIGALFSGTNHSETINMDFDYKPAFKISAGLNFHNDNWVGSIEYTRLRSTDTVSASVPVSNPTLYNLWGNDFTTERVFTELDANFQCKLDFIDMLLDRSYFVGRKLTFRSGMGLRVALISESLDADYTNDGAYVLNVGAGVISLPGTLEAVHRTSSWGIGPKMGLEMDWLLGAGIRFFGSSFADLLYTSYKIQTKSRTIPSETHAPYTAGVPVTTTYRDDQSGSLRTHLDLELGLGWGTYFDYNNMHFDLSAAYGFQVFFGQNMLRLPVLSPSNLYIQGVTVTARMDY